MNARDGSKSRAMFFENIVSRKEEVKQDECKAYMCLFCIKSKLFHGFKK